MLLPGNTVAWLCANCGTPGFSVPWGVGQKQAPYPGSLWRGYGASVRKDYGVGRCGYALTAVMSSSMVRVCCSPVVMFLSAMTPSRISFSPTRATKGICRALA